MGNPQRTIVALILMALSSAALAWGNDVSQSREIYHDTLAIRTANGQIGHAILSFTVTATTYVGENGNARWPDNRACYYNDIRRTLVRSLVFVSSDSTSIPIRDTTVALPNAPGRSWGAVNTCNDKIGEINNALSSSIGGADTWQTYIDGDRAEVDRILSQFGQVVHA